MARPEKVAAVAELTEAFRESDAAVLTEYRGLTVTQLRELRRTLGATVSYAVVKNTLTKIAARDAGVDAFDDLLQGPSAIAFVTGDPVEAAKGLRDFSRANPLLVIKGGVLDGRAISADEIRRLADVEPREVLLAKLAGAMKASLSGAVALFAAPLSQAARVLEALRVAAEQDPSLLPGGAGAPVPAPSDSTDASDSTDSTGSRDVADSSDSTDPTGPTGTRDVADSSDSTDPTGPTGTRDVADSSDSTGSADSSDPTVSTADPDASASGSPEDVGGEVPATDDALDGTAVEVSAGAENPPAADAENPPAASAAPTTGG